ncbi:aldo/keto reductase [Pedobacter frigiditerrae]|uniref:Aldo/keto reductase n=1 Tax=Pedobacter frigiditerrae TaxID=2530452 RepID=A0A4V2MIG2_9SPHI|nr:aldo/keto reductase [Pedobacter frigiditerrae]TCC90306.1 aldo/keto reductase [Pedobacter frigiditerrae]
MEYRQLGASGLNVPVLSFGTATFGGANEFFKAWGSTQVDEATRLINVCMDAGVNFFDTANIYSRGIAEEILGKAIADLQRDKVLISTKATFPMGDGPNDFGSGRLHLIDQVNQSLKRLNTDYIDVYHLHGFDANTPVEETLKTLDNLIQSGKIRYIAVSNFSGWHLMKSLSVAERYGWSKYIGHQVLYSLYDREFEWELMPLAIDQNIGTMVWSPLSSGKLGGKYERGRPFPTENRIQQGGSHGPAIDQERLFTIVDALKAIAEETEKTVPQVALNWLVQRPTVANIIIGARNEEQLKQNLLAVGWNLTTDQVKRLDEASNVYPIYPYWHQQQNLKLVPQPKFY